MNKVEELAINSLFSPGMSEYEERSLCDGTILVCFKGKYKDGSEHYEVTINGR